MTFAPLDGDSRTLISITEEGGASPRAACAAPTAIAWLAQMCARFKMWIEQRINLRAGMYI